MKPQMHFAAALVLAVSIQIANAALQATLPEFKSKQALLAQAASRQVNKEEASGNVFYTGKPFEANREGYLFRYRSYDAELNRWKSVDPSGFPDGANNQAYMPNPVSELDWQGMLTVSSSGTPGTFQNGALIMNGLAFTATTTKGHSFTVWMETTINTNNTGLLPSQMDLADNCHGFAFLPGYWIDNSDVATILNDEHYQTDEQHATYVEFGVDLDLSAEADQGYDHTALVSERNSDQTISKIQGKDGYLPVTVTDLNGTHYASPTFWE